MDVKFDRTLSIANLISVGEKLLLRGTFGLFFRVELIDNYSENAERASERCAQVQIERMATVERISASVYR